MDHEAWHGKHWNPQYAAFAAFAAFAAVPVVANAVAPLCSVAAAGSGPLTAVCGERPRGRGAAWAAPGYGDDQRCKDFSLQTRETQGEGTEKAGRRQEKGRE